MKKTTSRRWSIAARLAACAALGGLVLAFLAPAMADGAAALWALRAAVCLYVVLLYTGSAAPQKEGGAQQEAASRTL